jgi:ATP/maltotriose-dependent transcriptional regulator MalT
MVRAPSLVGRAAELAALGSALDRARQGRGGAVFLVGEAGIGKSRLAEFAAEKAARSGMRIVRGRASELGTVAPFRPIAEVILGLTRAGEVQHAAHLSGYRRALGRLVPDWWDGDGEPGSDSPLILAEAVLRLVAHAARDRGCLVVLEDLHAADPEALAVAEYLVDNVATDRVLLVATIRTEAGPALELARAIGRRAPGGVIELGPLSDDEIDQIAASCLDVPVTLVPPSVLERLRLGCAGNPFIVEEVLNDMLGGSTLTRRGGQWTVSGELPARAPATVVRSIVGRVDRLGEPGQFMLRVAALLGRRFPLEVVQRVSGVDDRVLMSQIREAMTGQLLVPDDASTDWYAFRHALTAEALRDDLAPAARAELARRIADVIEERWPDLPGSWCQLVAELRLTAGDADVSGRLFLAAGRRALAEGAAASAAAMLSRARALLADTADVSVFTDVMETLLMALLEMGQIDEALAFTNTFGGGFLDRSRRAAVHSHLALVATMAGRVDDGAAQLAVARTLVADDADDRHAATIDLVAAFLALQDGRPDAIATAEELAGRAAAAAEREPLPVVACQAWQLLGILARYHGLDQAAECFRRMGAIADQHGLRVWRVRALAYLEFNDALAHGEIDGLARVQAETMRIGAIAFGHGLEADLALLAVLRGEWATARVFLDECWPAVLRLRIHDLIRHAAVARAALAAHRGRRAEMDQALADFRSWGGSESSHLSLSLGLCQAMCTLLEGDLDAAHALMKQGSAHEEGSPNPFHLTGRHGLFVLLRALRREIDLTECEGILDASASRTRWNRQFVLLAQAILLGRAGRHDLATEVAVRARRAAAPFPMARHLGARLVAEAALTDHWGEPVPWLREAEEYFHSAGVPASASACRALLRKANVRVGQRRAGHGRVPAVLRRCGVTAREYDVLELVVDRWGNQQIARRLHISPRTVEKHVASLITKTGQADRAALMRYAAGLDPTA